MKYKVGDKVVFKEEFAKDAATGVITEVVSEEDSPYIGEHYRITATIRGKVWDESCEFHGLVVLEKEVIKRV